MVAFLLLAAATPVLAAHSPEKCEWTLRQAKLRQQHGRVQKLGELPPADQVLTVYREVDGCPKPVIVRREIGAK